MSKFFTNFAGKIRNAHWKCYCFNPGMNRSIRYILFVLLCGMHLVSYAKNTTDETPFPMRSTIILNAGISGGRLPALGFTFSRQGQFGYYASFMMGLDNIHLPYDYHAAPDGMLTDGEMAGLVPFYSGKRAINRFSGTVGALYRLEIPLFAFVGAGYGFRTETRELLNRKWAEVNTSQGHSGVVEVGLMGQFEGLTLHAGYTLFFGQQARLYHEAKVGIGYTFKE